MKSFIKTCRPKQWSKNLLVFAAPLLANKFSFDLLLLSCLTFICFCLISSSVYFLNDALDIEKDKKHPFKKTRPIAAGLISKKEAILTSILLAITGFILALILLPKLTIFIFIYYIIQISYSINLKNKPIIDILSISSGFLLRSLAGSAIDNIYLSPWYILTVGLFALFLAIEKRKAELRIFIESGKVTRKVLERYSLPLLNRYENIVSSSAFMTYSLWAAGPELGGAKSNWMLITVPFVLFGIFRYQFISDPQMTEKRISIKENLVNSERPEDVLFYDKGIKLNLIIWFITSIIIVLTKY